MRHLLRLLFFIVPLVALLAPRLAFADRVAVLPFESVGNATSVDLEKARAATRAAVLDRKHIAPTDSQMLTAEMAFKGEHGGGAKAFQAAGRASTSDWVARGLVETHGATYHLELEVCQVETGRKESLAREIDASKEVAQISEMLALLVRPEGIANADIPWERASNVTPVAKPKPGDVVVKPPEPPPPVGPPPVRHVYAEGHPILVGLDLSVLSAVKRPSIAQGPGTALQLGGAFGYALLKIPGLELRGNLLGAIAGPSSLTIDAGARYMLPIVPTRRIFLGPELGLGTFITLGAEKTARFLARGSAVASMGLGERWQIEIVGDLDYAAGGSGALVLLGGTARGAFRF
jgi:hypothetical protein